MGDFPWLIACIVGFILIPLFVWIEIEDHKAWKRYLQVKDKLSPEAREIIEDFHYRKFG